MKKIYAIGLIFMLMFVGNVFASEDDDICLDKDFGYSIARWNYDNLTSVWIEEYDLYDINIVGNARKLNWTSNVLVDGTIFKTSRINTGDGGYNGTIPKTTVSSDIQYVLFCKQEMEVPEYGMIGIMIILIGAALFLVKKK